MSNINENNKNNIEETQSVDSIKNRNIDVTQELDIVNIKNSSQETQPLNSIQDENNIEYTQKIDLSKNMQETQKIDLNNIQNEIEKTQIIEPIQVNNLEATQTVENIKPEKILHNEEKTMEELASERTANYIESKQAEIERRNKDDRTFSVSKEQPKKKSIKKYVVFVIIFAVLAISFTSYLIYSKNSKDGSYTGIINLPFKNEEQQKSKDNVEPSLIGSKYDQNDIKLTHTHESEEVNGSSIEYQYSQIEDGLKNETIKNKINSEIKNRIEKVDIEKYSQNYDVVNIIALINANFSNVLSVEFYVSGYNIDEYSSTILEFDGLNYKLEDGSNIEFKDLFIGTADIKNIITKSAYKSLIENKYFDEYQNEMILNMNKVDASKLDEEILEIALEYKSKEDSQNIKYYFNTRTITLQLAGNIITIDMAKFDDKIAIYNRFRTAKNLYKTNSVGAKNLYAYTTRYVPDDVYLYNDEKYDKVWSNIQLESNYINWTTGERISESEQLIVDRVFIETKKFIENKMQEYKGTKKPVYLSFWASVNYNAFENKAEVSMQFQEVEMTINFYENKMDKVFAQSFIDNIDWGTFMMVEDVINDSECIVGEIINFSTDDILPEDFWDDFEIEEEITNEITNEINNNIVNESSNEIVSENIISNEISNELTNEIEDEPENEIITNETSEEILNELENEVIINDVLDNNVSL